MHGSTPGTALVLRGRYHPHFDSSQVAVYHIHSGRHHDHSQTLTDRRHDSSHHITNPSLAATTCYPMTNSPGFSRRGQWRGCWHLVGRLPAGGASDVTVTPPAVVGHPYVSSVLETLRSHTSSFMPPLRLLRGPRIRVRRVTHSRLCNTRLRAPVPSDRGDS